MCQCSIDAYAYARIIIIAKMLFTVKSHFQHSKKLYVSSIFKTKLRKSSVVLVLISNIGNNSCSFNTDKRTFLQSDEKNKYSILGNAYWQQMFDIFFTDSFNVRAGDILQ